MNLKKLDEKELLMLQASAISELKQRKVVRTHNNPLGDYAEWLVSKQLNLSLAENSKAGYDATTEDGVKIQIKARRLAQSSSTRQLSAIRKYQEKDFDFLAAVIFDENYDIVDAVLIPHEVIGEYATYREHVNAHILFVKDPLLNDSRVKCIKGDLTRK